MLSIICLGSRDHFGTVLDALPREQIDSPPPPGEVSPSELQQQGEEFQEYIEMRDAVLVEAIVRQSRPAPDIDAAVSMARWAAFISNIQAGLLLQASPTSLGLVRLLMQLTAYEELDAAQLQSVTDTFSELQPPASLEWLKGTHKSSPILKNTYPIRFEETAAPPIGRATEAQSRGVGEAAGRPGEWSHPQGGRSGSRRHRGE